MTGSATVTTRADPINLGIIGIGQLAEHLVTGFCTTEHRPSVTLSPRGRARAQTLASRFSLVVAESNQAVANAADVIILAVPPGDAVAVAQSIDFDPRHLLICVAAGVPLAPVAAAAAPARTVRAMPVTSATVRRSATVTFPPDKTVTALLQLIGSVHAFNEESDFETAVVIATYYGWVYALMSEVSGWLEDNGLETADAQSLVAQMTRGACAMCVEGGQDMSTEAREIGRPGTYTGLGLDLLERMDALSTWRDTLDAVLEATRRGSAD